MNNNVLVSEIIEFLGDTIISIEGFNEDFFIDGIATRDKCDELKIDWVHQRCASAQELAEISQALLIICSRSVSYSERLREMGKVLILVGDPYYTVAMIGNHFFVHQPQPGIHAAAIVSEHAIIGVNAVIGANAIVEDCKIGDNCVIGDNVIIRSCVSIGDKVSIKSGAVLGEEGFSFVKDKKNDRLIRFPQIGSLMIGDNVHIGSHTCIDRGSLSDTIISDSVKINNLCHIAHNVRIGKGTIIAAHVNISGSTSIGSNVWIGPNATFRGHQKVGDAAFIGAGANVVCDVPDYECWVGNPAKFLRKNDKQ